MLQTPLGALCCSAPPAQFAAAATALPACICPWLFAYRYIRTIYRIHISVCIHKSSIYVKNCPCRSGATHQRSTNMLMHTRADMGYRVTRYISGKIITWVLHSCISLASRRTATSFFLSFPLLSQSRPTSLAKLFCLQ